MRAALLAGHRRLCVDVLTVAIDARQRTYDKDASAIVILSLVNALQPVLPSDDPEVRIVVPGPASALRVRGFLRVAEANNVSVRVLGMREEGENVTEPQAFVVLDPSTEGDAVTDFRVLIRDAYARRVPVIVHNHPRPDALYSMLEFEGHIPYELTKFESAFVLVPFALPASGDDSKDQSLPGRLHRYIMLRKYPGKWALWRYVDHDMPSIKVDITDPAATEQNDEYFLCGEFDTRPTDGEFMRLLSQSMKPPFDP